MDFLKTIKAFFVGAFGVLSSWLGVLAIPVYVLVACNVMVMRPALRQPTAGTSRSAAM